MSQTPRQHIDPSIEANRHCADERTELLEVISEMVDRKIEQKLREYMNRK